MIHIDEGDEDELSNFEEDHKSPERLRDFYQVFSESPENTPYSKGNETTVISRFTSELSHEEVPQRIRKIYTYMLITSLILCFVVITSIIIMRMT